MKKEELKKILDKYYSTHTVKSILYGRLVPSYKKAQMFYEKHNIPFEAWIDIKQFIKKKD